MAADMSRRLSLPALALAIAAFVAAIGVGALLTRHSASQQNPSSLVTQIVRTAATIALPSPSSLLGKDHVLVLLLGIDYDYDAKDQPFSSSSRSDTIMVASLDLDSKQIHLVSVPRDMEATFDGHDQKINAAYANGGIKEADTVIGSWLGLPALDNGRYFDRYMVLRIDATKDLVNAIGGIDVVPDETMNYDDNWGHLHIHFKGGKLTHMDGEQAVSYMRFRHDACSDPCRIKRQQQVIRLVLAKLERDKFNDVAHLRQLVDVTRRDVITNFSAEELLSLANSYADFDLANLKTTQIPFTGDRDTAYAGDMLLPNEAERTKIVAALLEPRSPGEDALAVAPAEVRVRVENGSGVPGLAATLAAALQKQGFIIAGVAKADMPSPTTIVRISPTAPPGTDKMIAEKLKPAKPQIIADDNAAGEQDVTIIVGQDYVR